MKNKEGCYDELVELTEAEDETSEPGDPGSDRRRAELVAVFSCFFVCSCMMLKALLAATKVDDDCSAQRTERRRTWPGLGDPGRSCWRSCVEEPLVQRSSQSRRQYQWT